MAEVGSTSVIPRLATAIGYIISPLLLPPLFFWWVSAGLGWPAPAVLKAAGLALVFLGILPLILIIRMVATGQAKTIEVRDGTKRLPAFLWAVAFGIAAILVATRLEWPEPAVIPALLLVFPINSILLALINTQTKISIHSASIAATAAMSLWIVSVAAHPEAFALAALAATPLVMWSRVASGAHTRNQVLLGALFGILLPVAELYLMTAVGWLSLA
jgi:PAP2 superfamily